MKESITIIGAGRTGRGMLGEMFFSDGRYSINFSDNNPQIVQGLREQGYYTIEMQDLLTGKKETKKISNFRTFDINAEREAYIHALSESTYIATALFPEAFESAVQDIVQGIALRIKKGIATPMAILLGANYVGLYEYFYPRIIEHFQKDVEKEYLNTYVAILTINANRKIVFPDKKHEDLFFLEGDNKPILMVEDSFKFPKEYKLPFFFKPIQHVEVNMIEKIWSENLEHISLAFLGNFKGYTTVNQSVADDGIRKIIYYAWKEAREAMYKKYGIAIPDDSAKKIVYQKFASPYFSDKLNRIARDTKRKLKKNDRLLGPAFLCFEMGILPFFITKCLAFGFYFNDASISDSQDILNDVKNLGISSAIIKYCELDIQKHNDKCLLDMVLAHYKDIAGTSPITL